MAADKRTIGLLIAAGDAGHERFVAVIHRGAIAIGPVQFSLQPDD